MLASEKIPSRITISKKSTPVHIGRAPGQTQEMNPSMRLLALNEALNETLAQEDYEQAAWLRDQIKAITEENPEQEK
jgi:protein arginine kinase activator